MVYLITFDLNGDDSNGVAILAAIGQLGLTKNCMANTVLLDYDGTKDCVYDSLVPLLKPGDRIFINMVEKEKYAGRTYKVDCVWAWLRDRLA